MERSCTLASVDSKFPSYAYDCRFRAQKPSWLTAAMMKVHTTLVDDQDSVLATSARPAVLPHTSILLKGITMLFSWPLYLVGIMEEAETIFVPCIDFYKASKLRLPYYLLSPNRARLRLCLRDGCLVSSVCLVDTIVCSYSGYCRVWQMSYVCVHVNK